MSRTISRSCRCSTAVTPTRSRPVSTRRTPRPRTSTPATRSRSRFAPSGPPTADETWDFGDGTDPVQVRSDGNVKDHAPDGYAVMTHRFARPGDYLPHVERTDRRGRKATARLHVRVEPGP